MHKNHYPVVLFQFCVSQEEHTSKEQTFRRLQMRRVKIYKYWPHAQQIIETLKLQKAANNDQIIKTLRDIFFLASTGHDFYHLLLLDGLFALNSLKISLGNNLVIKII